MNLESIFSALNKDQMNSSLGIICAEVESQGYQAEIEGIRVTSQELFENKFPPLDEVAEPLNIMLYKNDKVEQKFSIKFIDFHKIIIQEFIK